MWYFEYLNFDSDVKNYILEILTTCTAQIGPKIKSAQNLLKFGTFNISNMPISILMSKMIFIKYDLLGPNWSKIKNVQDLSKFDTFNISIMLMPMSKQFLSNNDQLLGSNLFQNQKCSEFIEI